MSDDKNTEKAQQTDAAADVTENQTAATVSDATSDAATERTDAQVPDQAAGQTAEQDEATDAAAVVDDASDADDTDDADDTAATKDADKSTLPDSVQFSVVFDDDDDSEDEATVDAGGDIYSSLASAEQSVADASDDGAAEEPADAVIDKDDVTAALIAAATGADPTKVKAAAGLSKSAAKVPDANDTHGEGPNTAEDGQSTQQGGDAANSSTSGTTDVSAATDGTSASTSAGHHHAADASNASETAESAGAADTVASADSKASDAAGEPTEAERDALASANASAEVTERNARHVNETLALAKHDKKDELADHEASGAKSEPTMTLASRIDRVLVGGGADDVLLKTYPTFALNKVSVQDGKGKIVLGGVEFACYAGHAYALLIQDDPDSGVTADVKRRTLMGVMTGLARPTAGTVMNKSANIADLEPIEVRGHRLGIVPQLHAVQPDLDAEQNVLYAMNASNRNFLKPKPVIARELLAKVGFTEATSGLAVGKLPLVQQRLVAIARAISTEAEVLILDEPTRGLGDDDTVTVFAALAKLAHSGDPKHCVIVLTASREIAEAADTLFEV
ncbi:ABC transporter ATP-binding protein [Bifidobacterium myosotis]|uniref:ABC transporter ATP-binding protein n=1 Tax=Bifidobacterium myosotis TaxID=1630166 RepID=A0A261FRQ9_9BIFI|nr:ABC transporter ATP-binding protein [Bifidobacterium myosotis]